MSNLDAAIEEINRVLIGNKSREVEEVYLRNSVRYINEFKEQPELNENQQIVLDWLKTHFYKEDDNYPLVSVCRFVEEDTGDEFSDVGLAYGYLTMKQEAQVLLAFANWTMEQEEE